MITTHQRGVSAQGCAVGVKTEPTEGSIIEIYRPEFDYLSRTLYQRWSRDGLWYGVGDASGPADGYRHRWFELARSGCVHVVREGWGTAIEHGKVLVPLAAGTAQLLDKLEREVAAAVDRVAVPGWALVSREVVFESPHAPPGIPAALIVTFDGTPRS